MKITIVAAVANNGVIGRDGKLPWRIPEEMAHFKELTMGKTVIMGPKTAMSVGALPGRTNIVHCGKLLQPRPSIKNCIPLYEHEIFSRLSDMEEVFVIGGAKTYGTFMPYANRMVISWLEASYEGDAFFPKFPEGWSFGKTLLNTAEFTVMEYRRAT